MEKLILSKDNLSKLLAETLNKYRVYGPVENDDIAVFDKIEKPSDIKLDFLNSRVPPKEIMFHQTETMFRFTPGTKAKIDPVKMDDEVTVIFGIRPCDAKSFTILDSVFQGDYEDPYYLTRRKNTTLIGLSCTAPALNCFCTSFDDSPASSDYVDVLFTDIGDKYYVEVITEKGQKFIKNSGKLFKSATETDTKKKKEIGKKSIDAISRHQKNKGISEKLEKIFEHPFWKEIASKCLGCGTCTYLCPTCHCFDIQDETSSTRGARIRVWDTCMNPEYTLHASGHNPRPARTNRIRNRVYHKYNYYPKNFDVVACVGCGRCVDKCPVNIDIIEIVSKAGELKS